MTEAWHPDKIFHILIGVLPRKEISPHRRLKNLEELRRTSKNFEKDRIRSKNSGKPAKNSQGNRSNRKKTPTNDTRKAFI